MKEEKQLSKEEVLQIPELIDQRKTYKEIAIIFDVHENTIKNWVMKLRKSGYKVNTKKGKRAMLLD